MNAYTENDLFIVEFPADQAGSFDEDLDGILYDALLKGRKRIVIDLKKTPYLPSAALRTIIKYHKAGAAQGVAIAIINPETEVNRLLTYTNLNKILNIFPSKAAMMQALSGTHGEVPAGEVRSDHFKFELADRGGITVARLSGFIESVVDMKTLEADINRIAREGQINFIFDLTRLTFLDSRGIGQFVSLNNFLKSIGGKVVFCGASELVADFFKILGLSDRFALFSSEDEAVAHFTS